MSAICRHAEVLGLEVKPMDRTSGRFSPRCEYLLLRVAQDALDNIREHAQPIVSEQLEVAVELAATEAGEIQLTIQDSGPGFDVPQALQKGTLGLISMERNAQRARGRLDIDSVPGKGTTITAIVPLRTEEDQAR